MASLRDRLVGHVRPYLILLTGAVSFVLLITCVNVANVLLARGVTRTPELALRAAIGAPRRRLFAQLVVENLVLALAGGP
jgi:putative ABC transport system permease protein